MKRARMDTSIQVWRVCFQSLSTPETALMNIPVMRPEVPPPFCLNSLSTQTTRQAANIILHVCLWRGLPVSQNKMEGGSVVRPNPTATS